MEHTGGTRFPASAPRALGMQLGFMPWDFYEWGLGWPEFKLFPFWYRADQARRIVVRRLGAAFDALREG